MTIPPRFLDELRARLTLSDIIGKRVRLTRAGREFKGCCPFHNEKSPSFYVNDDKQFFHCFGCGTHGSAIDFVMRHDNLSFIEAVETLAATAGMQVPQSSPADVERAKKEKDLYSLMDEAAKWMEAQLRRPENKTAYDYIKERGVPDEVLSAFRVGYVPADMQSLRKHLAEQGYTDAQMIEGGILKTSEKAREPYAFFRERVMFPVPDRRGRIVAFGGRILPDHLRAPDRGDFKPPKYINSTDTPLFHKGSMLYGEPHARLAASEGLTVIVVEGYLDVIACFRGGFRGAVAPLGTALTEEQILRLWKMIPEEHKVPVLCFDGDNAGRRAAARACERILPHLKPNHSAKIAFLPDGEDPDTLINGKGKDAFSAVLSGALNLVDFLWQENYAGREFDTPESRAGLSKALEDTASRITDRTVQHYYREAFRQKVREAFAAPKVAASAAGNAPAPERRPYQPQNRQWQGNFKGRGGFGGRDSMVPPPPLPSLQRPASAKNSIFSKALLACVINNPVIFHDVEEEASHLHFPENGLDRLRQAVLSTLGRKPELDAAALKTHLSGQGLGEQMQLILNESVYTHAPFARVSEDDGAVVTAWRDAWRKMQALEEERDIRQAKIAFQEDMSEENEARWQNMRKRPGTPDS